MGVVALHHRPYTVAWLKWHILTLEIRHGKECFNMAALQDFRKVGAAASFEAIASVPGGGEDGALGINHLLGCKTQLRI